MAERDVCHITNVTREYPHLVAWFEDPDNQTAQISLESGYRLLSAQEKLDSAGGVEQVRRSLDSRVRERSAVILTACRTQAMALPEIARYAAILSDRPLRIRDGHLQSLVAHGELVARENVIYVRKSTKFPDYVSVGYKVGFLTTEDGLAELVRRGPTQRRFPILLPRAMPQGI
jgi:hypothetical protein